MEGTVPVIRLRSLLGLVACAAVNLWLFRVGMLPGLIGLNVTKHVAIAALCRGAGVNRRPDGPGGRGLAPTPGPSDRAAPPTGGRSAAR